MLNNVGAWDRALRLLVGIAVILLVPMPWTWLAAIPLLTAALGYCPLYHLVGWSTCKVPARTR